MQETDTDNTETDIDIDTRLEWLLIASLVVAASAFTGLQVWMLLVS
jgi:hypothetical protein